MSIQRKIVRALVLASSLLLPCAAFAWDMTAVDPLYQQGIDALCRGEYLKSLEFFNKMAREQPDCAAAHYGRGKALVGLLRGKEAVKEFTLGHMLDPKGKYGMRCQSELDYLTLKPPSPLPQTVTSTDIENASARMTAQAADRINLIQRDTESRARSLPSIYRRYPSSDPFSISSPSDREPPLGWGETPSARRNVRRFNFDSVIEGRAKELESDQRYRSESVQNSVAGLQAEMTSKPTEASSTYLSPHFTDLYIRNYVTFEPIRRPQPPEALDATQLRLEVPKQPKNAPNKKYFTSPFPSSH